MDHGRLFSTGKPTEADLVRLHRGDWAPAALGSTAGVLEATWFVFGGHTQLRIIGATESLGTVSTRAGSTHLSLSQIDAATRPLDERCGAAAWVTSDDAYRGPIRSPDDTLARVVCDDRWFHIDAANGRVITVLDSSRRAYRWLHSGLHTLDFPGLRRQPGVTFSMTAVALAWRRLQLRDK
jgi:hypothetical protein